MAFIFILITLGVTLASGLNEFARSSLDYGVPFPIKNVEEYYGKLNFDSCGGLINSPTVINTRKYPWGDFKETCTWKIKTRKCFAPKITLLSSKIHGPWHTELEFIFGGETISFTSKLPGSVYYAQQSEGEIRFINRLGWNSGHGFQAAIDFLPLDIPECYDQFTDVSSMTCIATHTDDYNYAIETPGYPNAVPAATGCRQTIPLTTGEYSYEVTLKSNLDDKVRLMFVDNFSNFSVTPGEKTDVFLTTPPFSVLYRSSETEPGPGFRMEFRNLNPPTPCGELINVGITESVVTYPYPANQMSICTIKFMAPTGKKVMFKFNEFTVPASSTTEATRLFLNFPNNEIATQAFQGKPDTTTVGRFGVLQYKGTYQGTPWKLKVLAV